MNKKLKIGLIGFGTVGRGMYELIRKNKAVIAQRTNLDCEIPMICNRTVEKVTPHVDSSVTVTSSWQDVVNNPEIDVIVELIGGTEPAKDIIITSLRQGKDVVTANKKLLAEEADDILDELEKSKAKIAFEAAVGGGIPCVEALKGGLAANNIESVMGILNGTTNYILTKMEEEGWSFETALEKAQEAGFAEADPTFDIEGFDAGHKITLLAMLAFNLKLAYRDIDIEGITKITLTDIKFARDMGYAIKLLGIANRVGGDIDIRVQPTLISEEHQLSQVRDENNAVVFVGDMAGEVLLYGKGAGSLPTASAVVSDILQVGRDNSGPASVISIASEASILPTSKRTSRFYLRMLTSDQSGILEKIAHSFAHNNISIASLVQKKTREEGVPLLFMTHQAIEEDVLNAIAEINSYDFVKEPVVMMCIIE
jgi:homoserine dehydrogenase